MAFDFRTDVRNFDSASKAPLEVARGLAPGISRNKMFPIIFILFFFYLPASSPHLDLQTSQGRVCSQVSSVTLAPCGPGPWEGTGLGQVVPPARGGAALPCSFRVLPPKPLGACGTHRAHLGIPSSPPLLVRGLRCQRGVLGLGQERSLPALCVNVGAMGPGLLQQARASLVCCVRQDSPASSAREVPAPLVKSRFG